ncbi:MAG TPA: hypothetical protein ENJ95_05935 [Bacteroidetes bacterium]|nr:hypothetical protein [Bacteroidota bacterium]
MNIKTIILFFFLLMAATSYCQEQNTITLQSYRASELSLIGWFSGKRKMNLYKQGSQEYRPVGPWGKNIRPLLLSQPGAKKEWRKSRANSIASVSANIIAGVGLAFAVVNDGDTFSNSNTLETAGHWTFFGGWVLSYLLNLQAQKHLHKSVKKYNMEILRNH